MLVHVPAPLRWCFWEFAQASPVSKVRYLAPHCIGFGWHNNFILCLDSCMISYMWKLSCFSLHIKDVFNSNTNYYINSEVLIIIIRASELTWKSWVTNIKYNIHYEPLKSDHSMLILIVHYFYWICLLIPLPRTNCRGNKVSQNYVKISE